MKLSRRRLKGETTNERKERTGQTSAHFCGIDHTDRRNAPDPYHRKRRIRLQHRAASDHGSSDRGIHCIPRWCDLGRDDG